MNEDNWRNMLNISKRCFLWAGVMAIAIIQAFGTFASAATRLIERGDPTNLGPGGGGDTPK